MPFSLKVSENLQFLKDLDADQFSISQDNNGLSKIDRRSSFWTFFWGMVHFVTCGYVPKNRELDRICREILKEIGDDLGNASGIEKDWAENGVRNLSAVVENNGGSEGSAIDKMLEAIAKIQDLPEVQKLSGNDDALDATLDKSESEGFPENVLVPEDVLVPDESEEENENPVNEEPQDSPKTEPVQDPAVATQQEDTKLQHLLQDLLRQPDRSNREMIEMHQIGLLLPEVNGSAQLTDEELNLLGTAFKEMRSDYLIQNMSPELLACLIRDCFLNGNLSCLLTILRAAGHTFSKEQINALASGFENIENRPKLGAPLKAINPEQIHELLLIIAYNAKTITSFKTVLSHCQMLSFTESIAKLVIRHAQDAPEEMMNPFKNAMHLSVKLGAESEVLMYQILCRVKQASLLKEIILEVKEEANELASELIFKNNPALQDDPHNAFFQQLVDSLGASLVHKIAGYVFKHESVERKLILAANYPLPP